MNAYLITYLKNGKPVGSTVINTLEGEVADVALSNLNLRGLDADDFTKGTAKSHPRHKGAVIFTAN
jgi:hypothetical protein